jgi:hypothetical protein
MDRSPHKMKTMNEKCFMTGSFLILFFLRKIRIDAGLSSYGI